MKRHNLSDEEQKILLDLFPLALTIESGTNTDTLPYEKLDGLRFEKLCYEILCSEGLNPRYNGKSGQADYGVDIITEHQDDITVYQCKNITDKKKYKRNCQGY